MKIVMDSVRWLGVAMIAVLVSVPNSSFAQQRDLGLMVELDPSLEMDAPVESPIRLPQPFVHFECRQSNAIWSGDLDLYSCGDSYNLNPDCSSNLVDFGQSGWAKFGAELIAKVDPMQANPVLNICHLRITSMNARNELSITPAIGSASCSIAVPVGEAFEFAVVHQQGSASADLDLSANCAISLGVH